MACVTEYSFYAVAMLCLLNNLIHHCLLCSDVK